MQCNNCSFRIEDKERSEVVSCQLQNDLNIRTILTLGNNDKCPYYVKQKKEYDFGFE